MNDFLTALGAVFKFTLLIIGGILGLFLLLLLPSRKKTKSHH